MAEVRIPVRDDSLSGVWDEAPGARALMVVAHGAGNDKSAPFLQGVAAGLVQAGVSALRFNFPYTDAGRRAPDRQEVLTEAWRCTLAEAVGRAGGRPGVAAGKSLGGRMASMLAADEGERFAARAIVFFGYPLHPPGKPERIRDQHLAAATVPMLFIQGTADPFARWDLLEAVVDRLGRRARLHAVVGGDHSFRVRGPRRSPVDIGRELGEVAAAFVDEAV